MKLTRTLEIKPIIIILILYSYQDCFLMYLHIFLNNFLNNIYEIYKRVS